MKKQKIKFPATEGFKELKIEVSPIEGFLVLEIEGNKASIKLSDFYSFALNIFTPEQLDKMLIDTMMEVTEYTRQLTVKAEKDIKKGEEIVVRYKVVVPEIIKQKINEQTNDR